MSLEFLFKGCERIEIAVYRYVALVWKRKWEEHSDYALYEHGIEKVVEIGN